MRAITRIYFKTLIIWILIPVLANNVFAQVPLRILGDHGEPLPYATVSNVTKKKVYSANKEGVVQLEADPKDSIQISYVGFITRSCLYSEITAPSLMIFKNPQVLEMVVVTDCKKREKLNIQNFERKGFLSGDTLFYWSFANDKGKYAVKIVSPEPGAILSKLSFWTGKVFEAPDSTSNAPFIISFYEQDDYTGLPGEPLTGKPVIYFPKKTGKQTLWLDSLRLTIPSGGIYVSFQYILDPKFNWSYPARRHCSTCPDTNISGYGAELKFVKGTNNPSAEYGIFSNKWSLIRRDMTVQYEATISYCKEK